ncbi:UNVERIFIED_CONTAM: SAM-dependent methyltransferase [Paenibacillus sp. PvR008]
MPLSPRVYHWFVRPKWFTKKYIHANCNTFKLGLYLGIEPDGQRVELAKRLYPNHNFMIFKENRIPAQNDSIDYIFIIAVLHHIDDEQIKGYLLEFERILKPGGKIIVMKPYLCIRKNWNNRFMNWYDDGEYIRNENGYLDLFQSTQYECQVLKRFTKCFLYNEIFFSPQKEPHSIILRIKLPLTPKKR